MTTKTKTKTEPISPMTVLEDHLALTLTEAGFSNRQAAAFMGRSDKSIKSGCERAMSSKKGGRKIPPGTLARLQNLLGMIQWLEEGRDKGYLALLLDDYASNLQVYAGRDGLVARLLRR